jgi:hypothetical protein
MNVNEESVMKMDSAVLTKAEQQYHATMTDVNRAVRDPVITPFAMAMKLAGYREVPENDGCSKLRACPHCPVGKANYSTRYTKDGVVVWGCPHCQNITEH